MTNILDKVEKLGRLKNTERDFIPIKKKNDLGLLIIIGFKNNEHEYFHMKHEAGIEAVETILDRMHDKEWGPVVLHNKDIHKGTIGKVKEIKDFVGIIMIDETVRTIRVLDPNDLSDKED